ncbi:contractile injection system tape measure protein [Kordia jejudonensis]|uniref:contractile injection system tape measure protein n=1 Tax=Kordia jejudonensis TaxID=1348245 RepID=UPI00069AB506|nr:contractile injection system tape measure protein [Kordia jejudonensis]
MHTVHNIAFEVEVNHEGQHISWEEYYKDFFQDRLLPKIERLCNNWDTKYPNTKCSIDEIDINVEVESVHLEELQEKIITKIQDQLNQINTNNTATNGSVRATITSLASPFDALRSYLKNGVLPAYISVKNFKEWLGNIVQFTSAEKETLTTLFAANALTIERMLSLLRNDYEKFATILDTNQKITNQYLKIEASFFKKLLKAICEKTQLNYQEAQAEIWFKTLGLSSSLAQFSKTFIQLLKPKATTEQKHLKNTNEHQFAVTMLQAIVQHDLQQPIRISIDKIFDITKGTTKETKAANTVLTKHTSTKNNAENGKIAQHENSVDTTTEKIGKIAKSNTDQTKHTIKPSQKTTTANETQQTENNVQKSEKAGKKIKAITNNVEPQELKDKSANEIAAQNAENTKVSKEAKQTKTTEKTANQSEVKNDVKDKSKTSQTSENSTESSNKSIQSSEKTRQEITGKNVAKANSNLQKTQQSEQSQTDAKSTIHDATSENSVNSTTQGNLDQNNTIKTSEKEIDNTIFERLARNNKPMREIPLTTEKAGLILLNPFLAQFFNGAKLVTENNEISDNGKACMLLHFLATGTENVTDVELTLEKICLGIPLDTIINYQTPLTDEDKALCEELLQAVIQHWSVLKNSSSNTIRDMFLKREGNITVTEDSIKLVVERFAQDILLDKIPWSIGLFQLKWMDKMMHVQW